MPERNEPTREMGDVTQNLQELIEPIQQLARQAGKRILEVYHSDYKVEEKEDHSPLTAADLASHTTIIEGLTQITPDLPILSEESAKIPYAERSKWGEYWLVDPLDGTREFINRNDEFTVNIALIQGHQAVLGMVHVPVQGTDYFGWKNGGAYIQPPGSKSQAIRVQTPLQSPVRVVGSRSHRGHSLDAYLANLGDYEMVPMGSSIKLCLVAEGKADVYPRLGPTSEWDTAAAQAVVEYAGGRVVDTQGTPLLYNTKADYLNPFFLVYGDLGHDWLKYLDAT